MEEETRPQLVIIGGGEDKCADKEILKEIVEMSGKDRANISIITTATTYPHEVGEEYKKSFLDLGVNSVTTNNLVSRKEANQKQILDSLEGIDCIFFTGGDQLRISSILGGTDFHYYLKKNLLGA